MTNPTSHALVKLTIANTQGISPNDWELMRRDISLFLASINAKTKVCPMNGKGTDVIQTVFETPAVTEPAINNYLYLERDYGQLTSVNLSIEPLA